MAEVALAGFPLRAEGLIRRPARPGDDDAAIWARIEAALRGQGARELTRGPGELRFTARRLLWRGSALGGSRGGRVRLRRHAGEVVVSFCLDMRPLAWLTMGLVAASLLWGVLAAAPIPARIEQAVLWAATLPLLWLWALRRTRQILARALDGATE